MPFVKLSGSAGCCRRALLLVFAGVFVSGNPADAGDILRGGAGMSATRRNASAGVNAGADAAAKLQANAKDRLTRTTQALDAVKAMQAAARKAANAVRTERVADPSRPGKFLPRVKDGLGKNGLQIDSLVPKNLRKPKPGEDPSLWVGAKLPTQTSGTGGQKNVTIVQTEEQALLNWKTFNVGKKTALYFDQTAGGSDKGKWVAFNKVNDPAGRPSQILGSIKADGQVYVINQNGIIFGGASQVNVHTLVASGLPINDGLVARGLLNNPAAEFLFSALALDTFDLAVAPKTLTRIADPDSVPHITYIDAGDVEQTLDPKRDYTITIGPDRRSTVNFTPAGVAKLAKAKSDSSLAASYVRTNGNVTVEPGAQLGSPTSAEHVGGRVMLVGTNVKNAGTIATPDGQTILAAGLQVGIDAHASSDPSLRGLDVYVGAVSDPTFEKSKRAGRVANNGLIEAPHASVIMTGKNVIQRGVIASSTSISLNGRIDLIASYDAVTNGGYDATKPDNGSPFALRSTGNITLGDGSVIRILPEVDNPDTVIGQALPLLSSVKMQGRFVHMKDGAAVLAPNATVNVDVGKWNLPTTSSASEPMISTFYHTSGQIYLEPGSLIDVAGTTEAAAPLSQNIITVELRGAELSDSPLQRAGLLRGPEITVDLRDKGTFSDGRTWLGTPLADLNGFADLIEHTAAELTTAGGTVNLHAGGSVVLQRGSTIDVSGGWVRYEGGLVQTTRVLAGGQLIDIADATPDRVYDGIYNPKFTQTHSKWGLSKTYSHPLALSGEHYESGYIAGRDGGSISITAPSMAIDGRLAGNTTAGTRQLRNSAGNTELPASGKLALTFQSIDTVTRGGLLFPTISPTPPKIVFKPVSSQRAADDFALDEAGEPLALRPDRAHKLVLSSDLMNYDGFGSLTIDNSDGDIVVANDVAMTTQPGGSIAMKAANIDIRGDLAAPGGSLDFTAYDFSPYEAAILSSAYAAGLPDFKKPRPSAARGAFTLAGSGSLSTAGLVVDDRFTADSPYEHPIAKDAGSISIQSYSADLEKGGLIDVSGGMVLNVKNQPSYGNAGSISILAGQDVNLASLLGGDLKLASTLKGFSGAKGGSLTLQAPLIRVGEGAARPGEFRLSPDFFDKGGFSSFALVGISEVPKRPSPFVQDSGFSIESAVEPVPPNRFLAGLVIEPDVTIAPSVKSWMVVPVAGRRDEVTLQETLLPESLRSPVSLSFTAKGVRDAFSSLPIVRGDVVLGEGAEVRAGPSGQVSFSGETVTMLGSVHAPGGSIAVSGGSKFVDVVKPAPLHARATVYLGPSSRLDTAGTTVLKPDPFGRRIGSVLPGGSISISGNIVAEAGSVLDVSGATGWLDIDPATMGLNALLGHGEATPLVPVTSGLMGPLYSRLVVPMQVDSDGGTITLKGSQELFVDSTLKGAAGGPTALGGSLFVSSGLFYADPNAVPTPLDVNLVVKQSGPSFAPLALKPGRSGIGEVMQDFKGDPIKERGYFTADQFLAGGFDSLSLGGLAADGSGLAGVVRFHGPVSIEARQSLSVASGGVIYASDAVDLTAPYVSLGTPFQPPLRPEDPLLVSAYMVGGQPFYFRPSYGPGRLTVHAKLIDMGNLSLRNIGAAALVADGGDIRGDGTFDIAGTLYLRAGQIYPATGVSFTLAAYDYRLTRDTTDRKPDTKSELKLHPGSITIAASGDRQLPLSAGGELNVYATKILQGGVLRAPLGTINLGWDGSGEPPMDRLRGTSMPTARNLILRSSSETSVSAVDSLSGREMIIPYGVLASGISWIDPAGMNITTSGPPAKSIHLSSQKLTTKPGSLIDISGGGNLYAYNWLTGQGGTRDILASDSSFAVIPGYQADFAPYAAFNQSAAAQTTFDPNFDSVENAPNPGFTNRGKLHVGDRVYLGASAGLAAGYYTLLPARYGLLPGAVLVTPQSGGARSTLAMPDGSSIVSGFRFNDLNSSRRLPPIYSRFEVAPASVVRARATYEDFYANGFFKHAAKDFDVSVPRLPLDAGHLVFQAVSAMDLRGGVSALTTPEGVGAYVDISSPGDIVISASGAEPRKANGKASLVLDSAQLTGFGVESLLIGGIRTDGAEGTSVAVNADSITVDNAGEPLRAPEIILAAKSSVDVKRHSEVSQSGEMHADAQKLLVDGDGALLRVSSDPNAVISRSGVTSDARAALSIGNGATLAGTSLVLDSSHATSLSPRAHLLGDYVSLDSGQISLLLDNAGPLQPTEGLVLAGRALRDLQGVTSLSLLSYSSIDIYGSGRISVDGELALHAAELRGFSGEGAVRFSANDIWLDNIAGGKRVGAVQDTRGALRFDADTITLGVHGVFVDQYAELQLNASNGILLFGKGRLKTQGDLTATTPFVTAIGPAVKKIAADGALRIVKPKGAVSDPIAGALGASLTLEGASVTATSDVLLPSGLFSIRATTGDVVIGGKVDVGGTTRNFFDVVKYTDGGQISLTADAGDVNVTKRASLSVGAMPGGGNAGGLSISVAKGDMHLDGMLHGKGGAGGKSGAFSLDVGELPQFRKLNDVLDAGFFAESRTFRVRNGDVLVAGKAVAHHFSLSTDVGSITVSGVIDASGQTGGSIQLSAHENLTLLDGSRLSVAGKDFDSAGKGGAISLEAGAQRDGAYSNGGTLDGDGTYSGGAVLDIRQGSELDLTVASENASSAGLGRFGGTLHLRAPRTASGKEVQVNPIDGLIRGASSIIVEGYKIYDLNPSLVSGAAGVISAAIKNLVDSDAVSFIGTAGTPTTPGTPAAGYAAMLARLLGTHNTGLDPVLTIRPGAELIDRNGNITLGTSSATTDNDWNLQTYRYGPKSVSGILTMRATGNLIFLNALSDGFDIASVGGFPSAYTAPLLAANPLLPLNAQSWSYRLAAGADLSAADFRRVQPLASLISGAGVDIGSLLLGKNFYPGTVTGSDNALTSTAVRGRFQVIRTGSGDIDIVAGRDVQLLNQFATIYTAGTLIDPLMGGNFDLPKPDASKDGRNYGLGTAQQSPPYAVQSTLGGGNVNIFAQNDIAHYTRNNNGDYVDDSEREFPMNWLYRRSYIDPVTGEFGKSKFGEFASTTWWVDFSNFFEGVGALGGGNVSLTAGHDVKNVDAVAPTNARMPKGKPDASKLVELGGGDVTVRAGHDISGGVYYVERGLGIIDAGNSITTNSTRSPSLGILSGNIIKDEKTWLPTTLFVGKGSFDVSARGDLLLGPVANPFLLPQGINNSNYYKTYFSTYADASRVDVTSLGGSVTLREDATIDSGASPVLYTWLQKVLLWSSNDKLGASNLQPWLRLAETSVAAFRTVAALNPATMRATAFSGDINVVGGLTLVPSPRGTLDLLAAGSINGLQDEGAILLPASRVWGSSRINLSDANPDGIPGITTAFAYQTIAGIAGQSRDSNLLNLSFIDNLFAETGSTIGAAGVIQTKQALHAQGILHSGDPLPVHLYAEDGDISGLALFAGKASRVIAGQDITDISLYVQNVSADDVTVVSAGRDIVAYNANSLLRTAALAPGNMLNVNEVPLAGDIQVSGPGVLEVLAGRNLDLGIGGNNLDGTGTGISTIGNARNPYLPFDGASIVAGAGIGAANGLADSRLDFADFIADFIAGDTGGKYLTEVAPMMEADAKAAPKFTIEDFSALAPETQSRLALEIFYLLLRDAGRGYTDPTSPGFGSYESGFAAIASLFGKQHWKGDISTQGRDIRTKNGGDISIFAPGGGLALANTVLGETLAPPGIVTETGGNISIFTDEDVNLGVGRIFTLRGGNEIIWSSTGDIAAGAAAKTVKSAPPTRVLIDPQSGDVQTDLAGLATGGGIGVLATVEGVPPGDVDLIAPVGAVDAGDAGIRVSGNLNIAAETILNASNITVLGSTTGVPTTAPVAAPNIAGLTSASNTSGAANSAAESMASQARQQQPVEETPSVITVEVVGYGGGDSASNAPAGNGA